MTCNSGCCYLCVAALTTMWLTISRRYKLFHTCVPSNPLIGYRVCTYMYKLSMSTHVISICTCRMDKVNIRSSRKLQISKLFRLLFTLSSIRSFRKSAILCDCNCTLQFLKTFDHDAFCSINSVTWTTLSLSLIDCMLANEYRLMDCQIPPRRRKAHVSYQLVCSFPSSTSISSPIELANPQTSQIN